MLLERSHLLVRWPDHQQRCLPIQRSKIPLLEGSTVIPVTTARPSVPPSLRTMASVTVTGMEKPFD